MSIRSRTRFRRRPVRGTVTVLVALLMPVIIGVMALALDGGLLFLQRRQAQSIADSAALAGAYALYNSSSFSAAQTAAIAIGTQNGVTISSAKVTQPQTGYVALSVTVSHPRCFSAIWGSGTMSATATATARGGSSQPYSTGSLILLDPSASGGLTVTGGSNLTATAAIQVNSSSPTAVNVNGASQINSALNIVGHDTVTGGSQINGTVTTGVSSVTDPLASIPTPSVPSTTSTPMSGYQGYGSFSMQPGLYSSGVSLGNGGTFTMAPGLYYIQGGSFTVANGATLTGSGVTIYMDAGGGTISFQGGTSTTLTPPTSGATTGLTYFQNRTSSASPQFANGTSVNMKGTFYAAGAATSFAGGNYSQLNSQMVVKSMNISNGATIKIPYSSSSVASGTSSFGLVQ